MPTRLGMEVAGYKRNDAVGHDVRYRFRQSRDRGLRESPTRALCVRRSESRGG